MKISALWLCHYLVIFCCWITKQKLHRFINQVELVSPHHAAKELVQSVKSGQIMSLFQKSVKRVSPITSSKLRPQLLVACSLHLNASSWPALYFTFRSFCRKNRSSREGAEAKPSSLTWSRKFKSKIDDFHVFFFRQQWCCILAVHAPLPCSLFNWIRFVWNYTSWIHVGVLPASHITTLLHQKRKFASISRGELDLPWQQKSITCAGTPFLDDRNVAA